MGSHVSIATINTSFAIRQRVMEGKLTLAPVPANMSVQGQKMVSRFFTNLWLYEEVLHPAEWLLVFQTDSIICANSKHDLDDYLEYDWVGELHSGIPEKVDKMRSNRTLEDTKKARGIDDWREGFYEPMGYHTGGGGVWLHAPIWGTPELRRHIWSYCPEVKMTLDMDVARYMPGNCRGRWKM
ncbi:hypothetical protein NW755_000954 [Fusarium falciforme]|uniref:DUF5672 domain-containing protein n=1 Tax=Fusarium falciforme TaxID=195108 RepID=A0A9W8RKC3_9HYPO|nr:hypothetical protein NW755_000954 [Fusarium falciforme]